MTKTISISDDAWIILKEHLENSTEDEIDELMAESDKIWFTMKKEVLEARERIRIKTHYYKEKQMCDSCGMTPIVCLLKQYGHVSFDDVEKLKEHIKENGCPYIYKT